MHGTVSGYSKEMKRRYILILIVAILIILDYIILRNATLGYGKDLEGTIHSPDEVYRASIKTLFLGIPFLSIVIASIISLFTFKSKRYSERVLQTSLYALVGFYLIFMILGIRNLILW